MNKKIVQHWSALSRWLDNHKAFIFLGNLFSWVYYFWQERGIAVTFSCLLILWGVGKISFVKPKKAENPSAQFRFLLSQKQSLNLLFFIVTYGLLALFFISILLYQNKILPESALRSIGIIATISYSALHIRGIHKDSEIKNLLEKATHHPWIIRVRSFFRFYLSSLNNLNIYLYPFIAAFAFLSTLPFFKSKIILGHWQGGILLYIISTWWVLLNHYTLQEKRGFLYWAGKTGGFLKTLLYVFIPAYLFFQLIGQSGEAPPTFFILIALIMVTGAAGLAYKDRLYRRMSLTAIGRSGQAFAMSYLRALGRYGLIALVILMAYAAKGYTRGEPLLSWFSNPEVQQESLQGFDDLAPDHWSYPAINFLFEKGIIKPDGSNFIQPARVMSSHEMLSILFSYFGISEYAYQDHPEVDFVHVSQFNHQYPIFKTAYYLGLIDRFFNINILANKLFAVNSIGKIKEWPEENYTGFALAQGIIGSDSPSSLDQILNRSILAQMLYKLNASQQAEE